MSSVVVPSPASIRCTPAPSRGGDQRMHARMDGMDGMDNLQPFMREAPNENIMYGDGGLYLRSLRLGRIKGLEREGSLFEGPPAPAAPPPLNLRAEEPVERLPHTPTLRHRASRFLF